jgi:SAM-dependent methyltransferase
LSKPRRMASAWMASTSPTSTVICGTTGAEASSRTTLTWAVGLRGDEGDDPAHVHGDLEAEQSGVEAALSSGVSETMLGTTLRMLSGTGENALHVASLGWSVLGADVAATALAIARAKADDRGIEVEFAAADAFQLERLGRRFATVLDCGPFHTFDGDERPRYVASLASVTGHDGTPYVLCFSDDGPDPGPHPISQDELRAAFNPALDGMSPPSNRTGFRRDTTTMAHRPGWRPSKGSRLRDWSAR